jgi:uncharacterized surface protein with fasciclin (FAS1) repeats
MERLFRFGLALAVAVSSLLFAAMPSLAEGDIVDIAVGDGRFTTLVTAVTEAGLVDTLKGEGPFTVFAPTDDAFAALPEGLVAALLNDVPALTDILLYHVVAGKVMAADVVKLTEAPTVLGENVAIAVQDGAVVLNGTTKVVITDIVASNGVIHVIDAVLLPTRGAGEGDYLVKPGDTLSGIAHALLGNSSRYLEIVELTNAKHETDATYAFIENPNLIRINWKLAVPQGAGDIVDIAVRDGRFTTLVTAVTEAGLVETLKGAGPFTVLAPTDDAFGKLPEGTIPALLADLPTLKNILLYHVIPGSAPASVVVTLTSADTALGVPVKISVVGDTVMINDAKVIITDVIADNGIIHVIDTVLLPPSS